MFYDENTFCQRYAAETKEKCLLDVRTEEEFQEGHLSEAVNIPISDLSNQIFLKIKDKETPLFIYCRSGGRAKKAAIVLKELGFENVYVAEECGYEELNCLMR